MIELMSLARSFNVGLSAAQQMHRVHINGDFFFFYVKKKVSDIYFQGLSTLVKFVGLS